MNYLVIAVTSVVLFFPAYWLFSNVVGPNWGAGIAAFAMYIAIPVLAMKIWPGRTSGTNSSTMSQALESGLLKTSDYNIIEAVEVGDIEDEALYYLLSLDDGRCLILSGYALSSIVDRGEFPCSQIRVFSHATDGITYGIERKGEKIVRSRKLAVTNFDSLLEFIEISDSVVLNQPLDKVISILEGRT